MAGIPTEPVQKCSKELSSFAMQHDPSHFISSGTLLLPGPCSSVGGYLQYPLLPLYFTNVIFQRRVKTVHLRFKRSCGWTCMRICSDMLVDRHGCSHGTDMCALHLHPWSNSAGSVFVQVCPILQAGQLVIMHACLPMAVTICSLRAYP